MVNAGSSASKTWGDLVETWPAGVPDAPSEVLVLEGPAGIGKTHLLRATVAAAAAGSRGPQRRVLKCAPALAELRLVGSGLLDLCANVSDAELATLPGVQAAALGAALLRADPGESVPVAVAPDAVAVAFSSLVHHLAAAGPLLICVDDLQWLDTQTTEVLAFVGRRLPPGVAVLLAHRTEPGLAEPEVIGRLEASLPLARRALGPLATVDLERLLRERLGSSLTMPTLRSAVSAAAGNPLFALEVARTLASDQVLDGGPGVPFPRSLDELIGTHVARLPAGTQRCLAVVAALRRPALSDLVALDLVDDLAPAERAGLVEVVGREVAFSHPLYAAAAYDRLTASQRMRMHAQLADIVDGEEERSRHLALGFDAPEESVARALDLARDRALGRGAVQAALEAARLALRATPPTSPLLAVRQIESARLLFRVGEPARAKEELLGVAATTTDPQTKARALHELARVVADTESEPEASRIEFEALALAGDDPELLADIHMGLALTRSDDWSAALDHARIARRLVEQLPEADPERIAGSLTALAGASFYAGEGAEIAACTQAMALEQTTGGNGKPVADRAISVLGYLYLWTDDFPRARVEFARAYDLSLAEGDESSRAYLLSQLSLLELRAGNWPQTESHVAECQEMFDRSGNEYFSWVARQHRLWLAVYAGEYDEAIATAGTDIANGQRSGNPLVELRGRGLRGFCALARGNTVLAARDLDRYRALFRVNRAHEPALRVMAGDHLEALVAVGRLRDAQVELEDLVASATALGRTAVLASAARAEALLHAAHGDAARAEEAGLRSVATYDQVERPFDRARALLTLGQVHRRFRHADPAREALSLAETEFARLGARDFLRRTRLELGRVGSSRQHLGTLAVTGPGALTSTERQVCDMAALGMSNPEIAAALTVARSTVESHLHASYRKLGIDRRAQLGGALAIEHA